MLINQVINLKKTENLLLMSNIREIFKINLSMLCPWHCASFETTSHT